MYKSKLKDAIEEVSHKGKGKAIIWNKDDVTC